MVIQIKNLSCNKPYLISLGDKEFKVNNTKDIYKLLRIRNKLKTKPKERS